MSQIIYCLTRTSGSQRAVVRSTLGSCLTLAGRTEGRPCARSGPEHLQRGLRAEGAYSISSSARRIAVGMDMPKALDKVRSFNASRNHGSQALLSQSPDP
jgi:hypothetical protein